jgi:uncharacterized membrane protein
VSVELIVLRLLHVVGGMLWVGFAVFNTFYLLPVLSAAGPAAGAVIGGLQKRGLFTVMPVIALVTMISGARLLMITAAGASGAYFSTRPGMTYAAGAIAALVGFLTGLLITRPKMARVGELMASLASADPDRKRALDAEIGALRSSAASSSMLATLLILFAGVAMAVARYL